MNSLSFNSEKSAKPRWGKLFCFLLCLLIVGIGLFYLFYFHEKNIFIDKNQLLTRKSEKIISKTAKVSKNHTKKNEIADTIDYTMISMDDSVDIFLFETDSILALIKEETNRSLDEVEFSLDIDAMPSENNTDADKIIKTCLVSVKYNLSELDSLDQIQLPYKEVILQQWTTPIKNVVSYQRINDLVKIKGKDISKIEIFYRHGQLFLKDDAQIYPIPETLTYRNLDKNERP
jgi:hypothetical protein